MLKAWLVVESWFIVENIDTLIKEHWKFQTYLSRSLSLFLLFLGKKTQSSICDDIIRCIQSRDKRALLSFVGEEGMLFRFL